MATRNLHGSGVRQHWIALTGCVVKVPPEQPRQREHDCPPEYKRRAVPTAAAGIHKELRKFPRERDGLFVSLPSSELDWDRDRACLNDD